MGGPARNGARESDRSPRWVLGVHLCDSGSSLCVSLGGPEVRVCSFGEAGVLGASPAVWSVSPLWSSRCVQKCVCICRECQWMCRGPWSASHLRAAACPRRLDSCAHGERSARLGEGDRERPKHSQIDIQEDTKTDISTHVHINIENTQTHTRAHNIYPSG
jgi:hypothetical protein